MDACDAKIALFCKTNPKLHFLKNATMKLTVGKVKYMIIGSVLWSWIPESERERIQGVMSDYQYIYVKDEKSRRTRGLNATDISMLFMNNMRYIRKQLNSAKKTGHKAIVFTHHKPYLKPTYNIGSFDPAYESDCSILFNKPLILWAYGHTHVKDDTTIKGVKFYSNPKGYPKQQTKFSPSVTIKLK